MDEKILGTEPKFIYQLQQDEAGNGKATRRFVLCLMSC